MKAPRWRLFPKYATLIIALVAGVLAASGAVSIYFSYKDTRAHLVALQFEKAAALRLELAADYLVMAAWLAYLKSLLLLPKEEQEEPSAAELALRLQLRLQRLGAMREAGARLMGRDRVGRDELHVTHEFIGQMLGVRRAGVSEVSGRFEDRGILRHRRGRTRLLDVPALDGRAGPVNEVTHGYLSGGARVVADGAVRDPARSASRRTGRSR